MTVAILRLPGRWKKAFLKKSSKIPSFCIHVELKSHSSGHCYYIPSVFPSQVCSLICPIKTTFPTVVPFAIIVFIITDSSIKIIMRSSLLISIITKSSIISIVIVKKTISNTIIVVSYNALAALSLFFFYQRSRL